jgi:hypothetical protein
MSKQKWFTETKFFPISKGLIKGHILAYYDKDKYIYNLEKILLIELDKEKMIVEVSRKNKPRSAKNPLYKVQLEIPYAIYLD